MRVDFRATPRRHELVTWATEGAKAWNLGAGRKTRWTKGSVLLCHFFTTDANAIGN